jgi:hypothetical protein
MINKFKVPNAIGIGEHIRFRRTLIGAGLFIWYSPKALD